MHDRLPDVVPAELRERPQWVCWKYVDRSGKRTKCPVNPKFGWNASATDPGTWTTFAEAVEASGRYAGIAFAFTEDDPYCGIDLDDCLDEHGDLIWGNELLVEFDTYTEVSPSGRGLKLFLRGTKPAFARCKQAGFGPDGEGGVEVYDRSRVFAVTGDVWPGTPTSIEDRQEELDALCGRLWPHVEPPVVVTPAPAEPAGGNEQRCLDAVLNMNVADHSDGSRRLFSACCRCVEHDLSDAEAVAVIREYGIRRPFPKSWSDGEVVRRLRDAERQCSRGSALPHDRGLSVPPPMKFGKLLEGWGELRRPVLHGLLREGETMNVIAATKFGKSWLVTDLALAIVTGSHWLGTYAAEPGEVLIIDNELHKETSAYRIPKVVAARGYPLGTICQQLEIVHLRGHLRDIHAYGPWFRSLDVGRYKAIVIDAAYRFMPRGMDENDNGAMADVYNAIDQYADRLKCAFVCVHHSSKGSQTAKSVTDVGSGAGSQSRAVDTHLVFRPHEEDRCAVVDAAVRSWPPIEPRVLRWEFPVFNPDDSLDPADLKRPYQRRRRKPEKQEKPAEPKWDAERFVEAFVAEEPKQTQFIVDAAREAGLSERRAKALLNRAEADGLAHRWRYRPNEPWAWATEPQPMEISFTEAA